MDVSADQDVLQCGKRLIEADVLEGSSKAGLDHVVRASWARDPNALDRTHIPERSDDGEEQRRDEPEECHHHREHALVEAF